MNEDEGEYHSIVALIVDDEEFIRTAIGRIVARWKFTDSKRTWAVSEVHYAGNVPEARAVMARLSKCPDLVITDRSMDTEETGEVLIRELAELESPPRILFQSGDSNHVIQPGLRELYSSFPDLRLIFLQKPFPVEVLRQTLEDLFAD